MGRVTKPDQKWLKSKRQTFSYDVIYMYAKFHNDRMSGSMGTVWNTKDLGENIGGNKENNKGRITPSFKSSNHAASVATWAKEGTLDPKVQGSNPGTAEGG